MPEMTTPKTPKHLDPRNPLVLDTRELGRQAGSMQMVQRRVPAPAGLTSELIGVAEGSLLTLNLQLQSVTEGVLVTGTVEADLHGECGRCLDAIDSKLAGEVCELFAYEASATDETSGEDEVHRVIDDLIDVEPVVRDVVVLALPLAPLCRQDCPGLCQTCGVHWDDLPADHSHETVDPRWSALAGIALGDSSGSAAAPADLEHLGGFERNEQDPSQE